MVRANSSLTSMMINSSRKLDRSERQVPYFRLTRRKFFVKDGIKLIPIIKFIRFRRNKEDQFGKMLGLGCCPLRDIMANEFLGINSFYPESETHFDQH